MLDTEVGYRLSPLQSHAWQAGGKGRGYTAAVFALDERLERDVLQYRVQGLGDALEILRTELVHLDGLKEPLQYVRADARCHCVQARADAPIETQALDALVTRWLDDAAARAANLAIALIEAPDRHYLLLRAPTWVADVASLGLLSASLRAASAPSPGRAPCWRSRCTNG